MAFVFLSRAGPGRIQGGWHVEVRARATMTAKGEVRILATACGAGARAAPPALPGTAGNCGPARRRTSARALLRAGPGSVRGCAEPRRLGA